MAVCVGCGLEVNNGILEVNVCGDPVIPNTTTGGLQCDPNTENGCLKVVLNDTHAGCGLNAVGGALVVDPCQQGGIICGDTADDPEDNCIYINVQGQGNGACVPLADVRGGDPCVGDEPDSTTGNAFRSAAPSPNCNGLVRTCDGLWAPPALQSINFSCGQIFVENTSIANMRFPSGPQAADMSPIGDGFTSPGAGDFLYGSAGNEIIIVNAFEHSSCNPIDAMSWTLFNAAMEVGPGELWRFILHERICGNGVGAADPRFRADPINQTCSGAGWVRQAVEYLDRRNETTAAFMAVTINDNSTWRFGKCDDFRMEAMISFQRLQDGPTANANNHLIAADFQYRNMGHGYHHQVTQNCVKRSNA